MNIYLLHVDSSDVTRMIKQINKQEVVDIPFLRTVLLLKNQKKSLTNNTSPVSTTKGNDKKLQVWLNIYFT